MLKNFFHNRSLAYIAWGGLLCSCEPPANESAVPSFVPANMHRVEPITPGSAPANSGELSIRQGNSFSYALPQGWRVGEDGQYALTLMAPDQKALTIMVGNAGVPLSYPPAQFVLDKLSVINPENLQLGPPRPATPGTGFTSAVQFEVSYFIQGARCRGIAKCHVAPSYDSAVMAVTAALSEEKQWPDYKNWLPLVADSVSATNGAAFGMRGVMAGNLRASTEYASAAREYREFSRRLQTEVTDHRENIIARQNEEFRETLAGVQTYVNPYDPARPLALPDQYKHFWVDREGNVLGTDDPGADPNTGSTGEWSRMDKIRR